jgi:hypothetical protein
MPSPQKTVCYKCGRATRNCKYGTSLSVHFSLSEVNAMIYMSNVLRSDRQGETKR